MSASDSGWTTASRWQLGPQPPSGFCTLLLGKRFLDIMPAGTVESGNPATAAVIPLERTTVPYSLDEVGRKAERAAGGVDQQALAEAMHRQRVHSGRQHRPAHGVGRDQQRHWRIRAERRQDR